MVQGATHLVADSPLQDGVFWGVLVPAALLLLAAGATFLLYRHFAARGPGD